MVATSQHLHALDLARAGHLDEAEVLYRQLLEADPSDAEAIHFFGVLANIHGDAVEAERLFRRVLEIRPGWAKAWNSLGGALYEQGRFADAVRKLSEAVRVEPGAAEWRFNLGLALRAVGRLGEAAGTLSIATEAAPDDANAFCVLGAVFEEMSRYPEAEAACRRAIEIAPRLAEAHNNLGNVLRSTRRAEDAEAAYRKAVECNPGLGQVHCNLANVLRSQGRFDEAGAEYRLDLELEPAHTEPYRMLAGLEAIGMEDPLFPPMADLLHSDTVPDRGKIDLHFAMATVLENSKDYDGAFPHWQAGNALKFSALHWDDRGREDHLRRVMDVFDDDLFERHVGGSSPERGPLFVLGMPRSGTTLVEQILASHSQVDGGGEMLALGRLAIEAGYPEACAELGHGARRELGERYLAEARPGDRPYFTDKLPDNYRFIGFIRLILPNARIIHCRRDGVDTCLSCYRTLFGGTAQQFTYDLESLGREYRRYRQAMDHWLALIPDAIHQVDYEALIKDKDTEIRRLLDFCGLEFEQACLDFHQTERAVQTASANQVRQEIYGTAVGRWKHYEKHLQPLLEAIGDS